MGFLQHCIKDDSFVPSPEYVCLVTGAAGFIGSHLTKHLVESKHVVVALDNLSTGSQANLEYGNPQYIERRDFTHFGDVAEVFETYKIDFVFHLGALPRVQFSVAEPLKSNEANVTGTLNLLHAARLFGVRRFVYSSSSSVYGDQDTLPLTEDMKPNPLSPYALQKLTGEIYARQFYKIWGLQAISLRYFNVMGERQLPDSAYAAAIPKFTHQILKGKKPTIYGDGENTRNFTSVHDVVRANLAAAWCDCPEAYGEAFNVGGNSRISVNELVEKIKKILGVIVENEYSPAVVESKHTQADLSKIKRLIGWEPKIDLDTGLEETVNWLRNLEHVNQ
jgi:UDP-glucose 4-epimerase